MERYFVCVCLYTYPPGHDQLDKTCSGPKDSHSLLMSKTHQRLTINHQQLITNMKATISKTQTQTQTHVPKHTQKTILLHCRIHSHLL